MKKHNFYTLLYIIMILTVIFTCIYLILWLQDEGRTCTADPIEYYGSKTGDQCYCTNGMIFYGDDQSEKQKSINSNYNS